MTEKAEGIWEKTLRIKYDVVTGEIVVTPSDDISTFEALGILEAAKALIIKQWHEEENEE